MEFAHPSATVVIYTALVRGKYNIQEGKVPKIHLIESAHGDPNVSAKSQVGKDRYRPRGLEDYNIDRYRIFNCGIA